MKSCPNLARRLQKGRWTINAYLLKLGRNRCRSKIVQWLLSTRHHARRTPAVRDEHHAINVCAMPMSASLCVQRPCVARILTTFCQAGSQPSAKGQTMPLSALNFLAKASGKNIYKAKGAFESGGGSSRGS
jgi:hypothetical protein